MNGKLRIGPLALWALVLALFSVTGAEKASAQWDQVLPDKTLSQARADAARIRARAQAGRT